MKFIIISYATKNTPYEAEINSHLLPSLKKFNLEYDIEYPKDMGNWQLNTSYKCEFILKMLKKHEKAVVFIDADAEIWKYPHLFETIPEKYDLAVHFLHWGWIWKKDKSHKRRDLLSGTMYIPFKFKIIKFLEECIIEIKKNSNLWEQKTIQKVVERHPELKIYQLPFEYITFPNHKNELPLHVVKKEDIVIYHTQASRKYKHWKRK